MKTILVLEDEVAVMQYLRHILKTQYRLIEATSAEEALQLVIAHDYRCGIDLLISEVLLPRSSGIHVALLLRTKDEELPVILTCGCPQDSWNNRDAADLVRLGTHSVAVLQEPFSPMAVSMVVQQFIGAAPS